MVKMADGAGEIAAVGKRAEMEFVNNHLLPAPAKPIGVAPVVDFRIDDFACAVHTLRLAPRGGIGVGSTIDDIAVTRPRLGECGRQGEPAVGLFGHREIGRLPVLQAQRYPRRPRRPQAKADAAGLHLCPERQLMAALHRPPPVRHPRRRSKNRAALPLPVLAKRARAGFRSRAWPSARGAAPG